VSRIGIKRALISVYDKTGLEELAQGLHAAGVTLVSTGSTLAMNGLRQIDTIVTTRIFTLSSGFPPTRLIASYIAPARQ